jgi:hypothetical protein
MIVKVIKGKAFEPLAAYIQNGDGRTMIGGNMAGRTLRELSREVGQLRKMRPSLDRAVAHLMLSAAPEDPYLDSATWCEIAEIFLRDLGLQACPHIIVRHEDTDHQHIHIACLRIGPDGKTVPEANDRYKAERSVAQIEKRYGLRQVNKKKAQGQACQRDWLTSAYRINRRVHTYQPRGERNAIAGKLRIIVPHGSGHAGAVKHWR